MSLSAFAQNKFSVSGKVVNNTGQPAIGVSVVEKGTRVATVTGEEGNFNITISSGNATLVFSSVEYETKEVGVNSQPYINVELIRKDGGMEEVVVTALGIKREKKALTYASQSVGGEEMRKAANINFMDALSGKAAGIDIATSSSGAGGSTRAVLRGSKSLTGLSEPLYVIDGIPMVNNKGGQPGSYGGTDQGDGLSAINPGDIETMTVLRGANASILYGSQGANGVVIITTKKGKNGKAVVNFNSNTVFDKVTSLPEFQYKYGASGKDYSWDTDAGNYQSGYIEDFFKTGINTTNGISVAGGNDKTTAFFSYGNTYATGVMPTNTYNRNNFTFNQSTKLFDDKITISSNVMLSSELSRNRPGAGYYNNPLTGLYLFARERDFDYFKNNYQVFDSTRNLYKMNWYSSEEKQNNPYWEINKNSKLFKTSRLIASVKVAYEIDDHFKFETRGNIDYANKLFDNRYAAAGNAVSVSPNGSWNYAKYNDQSIYTDGILSYNKVFGNFSLSALAGASYQRMVFNDGMNVSTGTVALQYPNVFTFANIPYNIVFNQTINRVIKQGLFANATIGFKDMVYLDLAGRNDWASTLALTGNQSYFYPAVGISAIISEMFDMPQSISFLKVRASTTKTANEVPFNSVNPYNTIGGAGGPTGIGGITRNTQVPFTNLQPEQITSNEYGLEMRLFKSRLGLDVTYYSGASTNQFLRLPAPSGSGFTVYFVNAGKITNKGFEISVNGDIIRNDRLLWSSTVNMSRNINKIVELIPSNPDYQVGGNSEGFASIIKAGGSFNDLYIFKFARNDAGQIILDANGKPTKAAKQEKVGNLNPDFLLGWNNTVNYKNFSLSALINGKFGGKAFSKTEAFLDSYGVSERTADARDAGTIPINAIKGTAPVTSIEPALYYSTIGDRNGIMEPYVFSRTNVRLAQLVLGYSFVMKNTEGFIKDASVSLIGRNLFFLYKKAPYDPEQAMSTNIFTQGNDVFAVPPTKSYGVSFKLTF
ncbi:SusC/RagA family TonB-linked outer membrane protein [Niabella ginsengisoli]|uniref:SusC/RagA family TonB-linked outer membrane protein n=1 Tax=Niabella ginsengisoli TaxID=522298 RepID=A0ABS9SQ89_9BACT|nr:SusC/RagA family TonB-linked outer membrane protein [Niabella ginsengisoli]MCH5600411.1 SusC/RagA family TonB-linked outer membrane protein [Niabella ginsengisoli]